MPPPNLNPNPNPPLKILMTADSIGGVWSYCLDLARALRLRGVNICLAIMGRPLSRLQMMEAASVRNIEVEQLQCKLEWMDDPWDDIEKAGKWLLSLEERFSPDVIHLNGYAHGVLPFASPKLVVGHSCVLSWWHAVKGNCAPPCWSRYRDAVSAGLHSAKTVVAPSRSMLEELDCFYGPLRNTAVIYNGCEARQFRPGSKEPFILSAGRLWDEAKNVSVLAGTAHAISWPIFIAGECREPGIHAKTHLSRDVTLLGRLSREVLGQWYSRASIYVLPARYEPFGLSILEAALSGCALVLGDIPSLREIWGDAATFVQPNRSEDLKRAIESLIDDKSKRGEFSARARERALDFDLDTMANAYLATYETLLNNRGEDQTRELAPCA